MEARACRHCGNPFTPVRGNQVYCSSPRDCARQAEYKRHRVTQEPKNCAGCGQPFVPYRRSQKYAPDCECGRKARLRKYVAAELPQQNCVICGTSFQPSRITQVTCNSSLCRSELQRVRQRAAYQAVEALAKPCAQTLTIGGVEDGERAVYLFDFHVPFHDVRLAAAILHFLADFKPHRVFLGGDFYDHYALSNFDKSAARAQLHNLQNELNEGKALLGRIKHVAKAANIYWIDGNHEHRLSRLLWREPGLESLQGLSPQELYGLEGIQYLPFGSHVGYLGFMIEHGCKVCIRSAYTAWAERQKHGSSGISGHTHRRGQHSWTDERGSHTWIEAGCLCRTDPEWLPHPDWQQGFVVSTVHAGKLHLTSVAVYSDGMRCEGKFYAR